jgi:tetraacyldisaccharide 4'-kinase
MLYRWAGTRRIAKTVAGGCGLPVVCIGNLTLGGAGKTPVTAAVRAYYASKGRSRRQPVARLSRLDHRATACGCASNTAAEVGDEPLMLADERRSWISKDRPEGARAMKEAMASRLVVMDDGHQNPTLKKSLSVVVIDATNPFGNGHVFPKGPLREPWRKACHAQTLWC